MFKTTRIGLIILFICSASCSKYFTPIHEKHERYEINDEINPDSSYIRYYLPYKQQLDAEMSRVIGYSDVNLTKTSTDVETLLGNFFADALISEGSKLYPEIDFSFGTKGGLRIELQKGEITIGHIFELMPFENELVVLELSGNNVLQLAKFIASKNGQPIAGARMKIIGDSLVNLEISGQPFDASKSYYLLTYDYLANGGDNVRGLDNPINRIYLGEKVRDVLIDYVIHQTEKGKHINTQLNGRIIRAK